jgi:hypothetical protein
MALLLSACEIEPTPVDYIDRATSAEAGRAQAEGEVRDRVLAMGQALARRNAADAFVALAPAREVLVVGLEGSAGEVVGPEGIRALLDSLAAQPAAVAARDVVVRVAPRANVAWFHAALDGDGEAPTGLLRISGVYELNEGAWQLVQAHLSAPVMRPSPTSPEEDADSAAAE